jgi:putative hydrolases of HD superfamily
VDTDILKRFYSFATLLEGLKKIERFKGQFYWRDYPELKRYESVADHSWRLAMLVILLEKQFSQNINLEKAIKIALIHDIPEILSGDASPLGEDGTGKHT